LCYLELRKGFSLLSLFFFSFLFLPPILFPFFSLSFLFFLLPYFLLEHHKHLILAKLLADQTLPLFLFLERWIVAAITISFGRSSLTTAIRSFV
jgi:hypothetical protein